MVNNSESWWSSRQRRCSARNCSVSGWSAWSTCAVTCGTTGTQRRTRWVTSSASCGGRCSYSLSDTRVCNRRCCPRHCSFYYTSWSSCSGCGIHGRQYKRAVIRIYNSCGGRACPSTAYQYRTCNTGRSVNS